MNIRARIIIIACLKSLGIQRKTYQDDVQLAFSVERLPDVRQRWVRETLARLNLDMPFSGVFMPSKYDSIPLADLLKLADFKTLAARAALLAGVSTDLLMKFVVLESPIIRRGGVEYLYPKVVNSLGYSGLFQFDKRGEAWERCRVGIHVSALPPFSEAWSDPFYSALAAGRYARLNFSLLQEKFGYRGPLTVELAYLMHNQGASGAYNYLKGRKDLAGSQSEAAIQVAMIARAQASSFA
jgi:hypothetical protein